MHLCIFFLFLHVKASNRSFFCKEDRPLLYSHLVNAFSPAFKSNGTEIIENFMNSFDPFTENMVVPFEQYNALLIVDFSIFFNKLYAIVFNFYLVKGLDSALVGASNVVEEAYKLGAFLIGNDLYDTKMWQKTLRGYMVMVLNIYLHHNPGANVAQWLLKLSDKLYVQPPNFLPQASETSLDVFEVIRAKHFNKKYMKKKSMRYTWEQQALDLISRARLGRFRDRFIGTDLSSTQKKQNELLDELRDPDCKIPASILPILEKECSKSFKRLHSFVFNHVLLSPSYSISVYIMERLHLEHSYDDYICFIDSWLAFCSALTELLEFKPPNPKIYIDILGNISAIVKEMMPKQKKFGDILYGQFQLYFLAFGQLQIPGFQANSLYEYVRILPVWLKKVKKHLHVNFPFVSHLTEEMSLCAVLMNYNDQQTQDLISASLAILNTE